MFHVVRDGVYENSTSEPMLMTPPGVLDGIIDVVQEDLPDAGAAVCVFPTPVGEPSVVRPDTGEPQVVVIRCRGTCDHRTCRKEGWDRIREENLCDDTIGLELGDPALLVPVAILGPTRQVLERIRVLAAPCIELVQVLGFQIGAVLLVVATGMAVGRDQHKMFVEIAHGRNASAVAQM